MNTVYLKKDVKNALEAFKMWILITKGFHQLTTKEAELFALLLLKWHEYSSKIKDDELLNDFITSVKARKEYKEFLGYDKESAIINLFSRLKAKGVMKNGKINPVYIPKLSEDFKSFEIKFLVNIKSSDKG